MLLSSETLRPSLPPGPIFPRTYPTIEPDVLANSDHFVAGQPFDLFVRLRAEAPVAWQHEGAQGQGFWALTRYDDVLKVDSDPQTFSSQKGGILMASVSRNCSSRRSIASYSLGCLTSNMRAVSRSRRTTLFTPSASCRCVSHRNDARADAPG